MNKPKIFDQETFEYMIECGVDKQKVAQIQHDKLKLHILEKLEQVRKAVLSGELEEVRKLMFVATHENYCIDFGWDNHGMDKEQDLYDIMTVLVTLKSMSHAK